jgi:hypothetical protein
MSGTPARSWPAAPRGQEPVAESADRELDRLLALIDSAVAAVEEETIAIRRSGAKEIENHAGRKGQFLVSLGRVLPSATSARNPVLLDRLVRLRAALDTNKSVLKLQMDAVAEVSRIIVNSVHSANSDGTYAPARRAHGHDEW